jgi:hypothetical protein
LMPEGPDAVDIRAQGRLAWGKFVHTTHLGASAVSASPGGQFHRGPYDGRVLPARLQEPFLADLLGWRSSSWRTTMDTSERGQVPPDLVRGRTRFQAWRGRRKAGDRIPQALWEVAIRLANALPGVRSVITILDGRAG